MSFIANRYGRRGHSLVVGDGKEVLSALALSFAVVVVIRCSRVVLNILSRVSLRHMNLKEEISVRKRIRCFLSTPR